MTTPELHPTPNDLGVGKEVTITRIFDAPRELVYDVWTDERHIASWFGPRSFTNPVVEMDVRPGGRMVIHMQAPDGSVFPSVGTFTDVTPPERLAFTSAAYAGVGGPFLLEDHTTITFTERAGRTTELTLHAVVTRSTPEAAGALDGMEQGWNESFDKLALRLTNLSVRGNEHEHIAATDPATDLVITRAFAAPPDLVFQAWTDPDCLVRWWGTSDMTGTASEIDLRAGGAWRACMRSPEGVDHWAGGTFQDIDPPRRLVMTFAWEAMPAAETVLTVTFDERDGATVMTFRHSGLTTEASRNGHAEGWSESFDKLAGRLAAIA